MTLKISSDNIQSATLSTLAGSGSAPKVTSITYPGDDTAASTAGGQTITLTGSGFNSGAAVLINGSYAGVVTVVNSTTITFTSPANSGGTYALYVINTDGGTAISVPGISYSGTPAWSTAAGSLASLYELDSVNSTVTATGDATVSYSLFSGTLPTGSSLNTSTGAITGTSVATGSPTTYSFVIRATDGQNQDTDRSFSITINPDAVTWNSPADGYVTSLSQDIAMATFTMNATSAAGRSITYTANSLPTGLSIDGATIVGTPTVIANSGSLITATAATTGRTATRTFNWQVVVSADTYWPYTTLLLNGEGVSASNNAQNISFIDGSTNAFTVTRFGDTYQGTNSPFSLSSWSNYFDGSGDYLDIPHNTNQWVGLNTDFTIECWFYVTSTSTSEKVLISKGFQGSPVYAEFVLCLSPTTNRLMGLVSSSGSSWLTTPTDTVSVSANTWYHAAMVRSGTTINLYKNGVVVATSTDVGAALYNHTGTIRIGQHSSGSPFTGYISNARFVNGTAVYTSQFTPSTTPLTAITNTNFLTCQSNRFIDNSTNAFTITKTGDVSVTKFSPFRGGIEYSTSTHGGSAYFDGTGDYLTVPANAAFAFSTGNFAIEAWVNASTSDVFVGQGAASSAFGLGINSGGYPYASVDIQYGGAAEGGSITLTAPTGLKFTSVLLAGYGSSVNYGQGPNYTYGTISGTSRSFVESALLGNTGAITIGANNANFGDPTPSVGKALAVLATVGLISSTTCNTNSWNHLALVRNGTALTLYLNGVSVATATYSTSVGSSANAVSIGATTASGSVIFPTTGNISNLRIVKGSAVYTSAFTPPTSPVTAISGTSLLMNFTNAGIIDQTGFNNIITVGDAKISTVQKKYGSSSMYFDGSGDGLLVPTSPLFAFGSADFTIEFWYYPTSTAGTNPNIMCNNSGSGSFVSGQWSLHAPHSSYANKYSFWVASSATNSALLVSTTNISTNTWTHIAISRSGNTWKLFLNGTSEATATHSGALDNGTTNPQYIGYQPSVDSGRYITGYIDDLRFTKGVARYTADFTTPTVLFAK